MSVNVAAHRNIFGRFSDTHSILDDFLALPAGANRDLVTERNILGGGDVDSGIVLHAPAFELFALADVPHSHSHLIRLVVNDECNHADSIIACSRTPARRIMYYYPRVSWIFAKIF